MAQAHKQPEFPSSRFSSSGRYRGEMLGVSVKIQSESLPFANLAVAIPRDFLVDKLFKGRRKLWEPRLGTYQLL